MSFFFGKGSKQKPQFTGLQTQTSSSAVPVALVYGKNRIAPNIIWQNDFKAKKQKQKAGKGMGGSVTSYTYSGSFQLALCWGPIEDVTRVWKDQSKETSYAALGFSLFVGENPQAPWGYLTSAHPDEALGYPGVAHLSVANYDLGQSNGLAQHSFEVEGLLFGTGFNGVDADPAQIIDDFLTSPAHGVGFDTSVIDQSSLFSGPDAGTTGDSAFQTYCTAMGFALSPALVSQSKASEIIERWLGLCNTAAVWTGYSLKFIPYGADEVEDNGVKYLPDFPVRYMLTSKDFISTRGSDPIIFNRVDPADASNSMSIVIANRENEYNDLPVPWRDQGLVDQFGRRQEDSMDAKEVCVPDMATIMVAFIGQRKAYIRNTFEFKLPSSYCRLEPMDVVGCTDPRFGTFYVLIQEIDEQDNGELSVVAEEYIASITRQSAQSSQEITNTPMNTAVAPGPVNTPLIFEPPPLLSGTPQVWVAASGGDGTTADQNWGGCFVWLSTDDITYNQIGDIDVPARMGVLTATLANFFTPNPDTLNTLSVDLRMSEGELEDAPTLDAENGATVSYVDGEFISYETVTLTGTNQYNLTNLWRGQYGSARAPHFSGSTFVRLDENVFKYDLPPEYIGQALYIKLQSYNLFGRAAQDLADCVAYTYVPTGGAFGTGTGGTPAAPTGLSSSSGAGYARLTWSAPLANDSVTSYQIFRATGASQPFSSAAQIDTVPGESRSYNDTTGTADQPYTYFIRAVNAVGPGTNSSGVNATPTATGGASLWEVSATGTGASQNITLPVTVSNADRYKVLVFVNGLRYDTSGYSISGTTLTITTNAAGDLIQIVGIT